MTDVTAIEQYKLFVELVDRLSARRLVTNRLYITMSTGLLSAIALFGDKKLNGLQSGWMAIIGFAGIVLCIAWSRQLLSFRQLSRAKFEVIHELEESLPYPLFTREWELLGSGRDPSKYRSFTKTERWIPMAIGILYGVLVLWGVVGVVNG